MADGSGKVSRKTYYAIYSSRTLGCFSSKKSFHQPGAGEIEVASDNEMRRYLEDVHVAAVEEQNRRENGLYAE